MGILLIWIFSPQSVRKWSLECALPIIKEKRREGRRSNCQQEELLLQMCPLTPISCSQPTLWGLCSGRSPSSCEARDFSSYKAVVCDMSRQVRSKTTEKQGMKEIKLGKLKNAFCRNSLKPWGKHLHLPSSLFNGTVYFPLYSPCGRSFYYREGEAGCLIRVASPSSKTLWVQDWKRESAASWGRWSQRQESNGPSHLRVRVLSHWVCWE